MTSRLEPRWFALENGLPALPNNVLNVLSAVENISVSDYDIIGMIHFDMALACRVLHAANGPLYGFSRQVASLQQASGLLGPGAIKNIILTTPILERFQNVSEGDEIPEPGRLWKHAAIAGAFAGRLAKSFPGAEGDVCFTAGLIHNLGRVALTVHFPQKLMEIARKSQEKGLDLKDAEKETFGYSEVEVGAEIAKCWGFPNVLNEIMHGIYSPASQNETLVAIVRLACHLAYEFGYEDGFDPCFSCDTLSEDLEWLNISPRDLDDLKPALIEFAREVEDSLED